MREYKKIKIETEELTKVLCDTCKKEIHEYALNKTAYVPSKVITVKRKYSSGGWAQDILEFCSLECFLEWAKGEVAPFDVSFPRDVLNNLASEYARLKSRDSRLTALESANTEIKEVKTHIQDFTDTFNIKGISKTIDMHLRPRIKQAKDFEDIQYCQGILSAIGDFLVDDLYNEIQELIYKKKVGLGILPF